MQIANPIYDTVFKYMMSDSKVAKTLLSAIIGEKIVELEFTSTEYTLKAGADKSQIDRTLEQITVCRFDFAAKIETETGEYKTVIIELQKKKLLNNDSPIIKVDYTVSDLTTGEELNKKNEFIESLNHKSWIVQVGQLKEKRRTELENLLSIFDQDNITDDKHILNIDENQFSVEYQHIIRKLREACESRKVREEMQMEDDYISELLMKDEIIVEQEKTIEDNKKTIAENEKALAEKDKEIEELKRQLKQL